MGSYILRRLLLLIPLLVVVSFLAFSLIHLGPLDPAEVILQAQGVPDISEALIHETKERLGLNRPFILQYWNWAASCLQLDFGLSYVTGQPVWSLLWPAFRNTLKLTFVSVAGIVALSILLGILCAKNEGKLVDRFVRGTSFFLIGVPSYWLASMLIWLLAVRLDLLPTSGMDTLLSYVLPVAVLTVSYAGIYFRFVRSAMISNLNADYVLYGRACGLPERTITFHLLRNSLHVAVTVFGMAVPILLGSTVVIENIFAWPGLGSLSVDAIRNRDLPLIQAYVLVLAAAFVVFNAGADLWNAALNPKLRKEI